MKVRVTRSVAIPDPVRVERALRAPELGPAILFFSGGTAIRGLSRKLKLHTHNSTHLITAFDSGGSSARLRHAFDMLSIGDLRNRMLALADESAKGAPEIYQLFRHRFPANAPQDELRARLQALIEGRHTLIASVPQPMQKIVCNHLRFFAERMPSDFDLQVASIGNLVLAGGYLNARDDIDSVLFIFSRLVAVRGQVQPIVETPLHLAATLADGSRIVGQHRITAGPPAPIASLSLVEGLGEEAEPAHADVSHSVERMIRRADLICFPMGSFYTSVIANLLPGGVGRAVAEARCPKVFVPSTGIDSECPEGMSVAQRVRTLLDVLRADAGAEVDTAQLLDFVLLDRDETLYHGDVELDAIRALGITPLKLDIVSRRKHPRLDALALSRVLISLAS